MKLQELKCMEGTMTNYIPADELKAEIKIIQQSLESRDVRLNQVKKIRTECMIEFCKCIFEVIDSLQQEQPEVDLKMVVKIDNIVMNMLGEGYNNGYKTRPFYEEVLQRLNARKEKNK